MKSRWVRAGLTVFLAVLAMPVVAHAQYQSPGYRIEEIFIGSGGEVEACSTSFCSAQMLGGTAVGDTASTNFRGQGGFGTPGEPVLSVAVYNTAIDFGVLNTSSTASATSNFNVKNYLSHGYVVRIHGDPPTNHTGPGTHPLTPLNSPSVSQAGTEQFGINLVANTTPGIGADPVQVPDNTFSFGAAAPGYNTADNYKYVDSDVVAQSTQSSGETDYTISIIANIANSTPGGQYRTTLVVQAIATF